MRSREKNKTKHVRENNRVKQAGEEWNRAFDMLIFTTQDVVVVMVVVVNKDSGRSDWQKQR